MSALSKALRMKAFGIDPGLRKTAVVFVEAQGPSLPRVIMRATVRPAFAPTDDQVTVMARDVTATMAAWAEMFGAPELVAIEGFAHRPYLATADGSPRRVNTSPEMGRLVGMLTVISEQVRGWPVVVVPPDVSKAGYPSAERFRAPMLPRELKTKDERDAFLVAAAGISLRRRVAKEAHP